MTGFIIAGVLLIIAYGFSRLQAGVYSRFWNRNLTYSVSSPTGAVFEGEKTVITDLLTNGKKLPLPWVHVSYRISRSLQYLDNINRKIDRGERRSLLYIVGMNKTVTRKSTVLCSKRGYYQATGLTLSSNNLLMSNHTGEKAELAFQLLVYPRLVDYPETVIPFRRMLGDALARRFIDPDPFTFKGIREYQPFDSFRQINWGATARTGVMMSNIYDFTVFSDLTILLNLQNYNCYDKELVFEEAIRLTAFLCRQCLKMRVPVSLVCPSGDGSPVCISAGSSAAHLEMVYTALAFIEYNVWNESVADYFPTDPGKAFVLISSCHDEDIYERFLSERKRNSGAFWIIPCHARNEIAITAGEDIFVWEVGAGSAGPANEYAEY